MRTKLHVAHSFSFFIMKFLKLSLSFMTLVKLLKQLLSFEAKALEDYEKDILLPCPIYDWFLPGKKRTTYLFLAKQVPCLPWLIFF